jgi:hypothetical protein
VKVTKNNRVRRRIVATGMITETTIVIHETVVRTSVPITGTVGAGTTAMTVTIATETIATETIVAEAVIVITEEVEGSGTVEEIEETGIIAAVAGTETIEEVEAIAATATETDVLVSSDVLNAKSISRRYMTDARSIWLSMTRTRPNWMA